MKINPNYSLRSIGNVHMLVPIRSASFQPELAPRINDTGMFLWNMLTENEQITKEQLLHKMLEEFDIDAKTAQKDMIHFIASLEKIGAIITE